MKLRRTMASAVLFCVGLMLMVLWGTSCETGESCTGLRTSFLSVLEDQGIDARYDIREDDAGGGGLECSIWIPLRIRGRLGEASYEHHAITISRFSDPAMIGSMIRGYQLSGPDRKDQFAAEAPVLAAQTDRLAMEGYIETVLLYKCGKDLIEYSIAAGPGVQIRPMSGLPAAIKSFQKERCPSEVQ